MKFYFYILILVLLVSSCAKKNDSPALTTSNKVTIQATGGTNQTDSIGKTLVNDIVVSINEPGTGLNNLLVQIFQNTLCNGDSVTERTVTNGSAISFKWKLSSKPGIQTLKFKILNSSRNIIDSINVTATALPPSHGWHVSSCLVPHLTINELVKLSSGRLIGGTPEILTLFILTITASPGTKSNLFILVITLGLCRLWLLPLMKFILPQRLTEFITHQMQALPGPGVIMVYHH